MSSLIAVKISRGKENRRISFDYQNIDLNQVKKVTSELFGIPYEFSFVYLDHEGDEISLGSEMEWKEALRISPYDNAIDSSAINLRIVSQNYKKKGLQKREKKNKNKKEKEPVMIHNAFCDMCNDRIEGARFNCLECPDFDLCDECMTDSRKDHPAHQFACITNPFHLQQLKKYKSDKLFQEEEAEAPEPCMLESVVPELPTLVESQIWDVSRPLDDSLVDLPELHAEEEENEDDYDDDDFVDWESSSESGDEEAEEEQLFDAQADQVPALVEDLFESKDANEESEDEEEEPLASESEDEEEECPSLAASDIPAVEIAVVEVPVVTPSPLAASVSQTQYAEQHRQLVDMGFHDLQRNEACLIENEGDLVQAVLSLLG